MSRCRASPSEHIFPQNPEPSWRSALDADEYALLSEKYLNTVGNLTLSGNNGRLGNKAFIDKRDMNDNGGEQGYRFSRLWLNRDLQSLEQWGVEEVEARTERIAKRFPRCLAGAQRRCDRQRR